MNLGANKTFSRSRPWVLFRAAALYDGFDTSASANAVPSSRALDRTRSWLDRALRSLFSVVLFPIAWPERRPFVVQNTEMPLPGGALSDVTGEKSFYVAYALGLLPTDCPSFHAADKKSVTALGHNLPKLGWDAERLVRVRLRNPLHSCPTATLPRGTAAKEVR